MCPLFYGWPLSIASAWSDGEHAHGVLALRAKQRAGVHDLLDEAAPPFQIVAKEQAVHE